MNESEVTFQAGWSHVAFAALALSCGCPPNRIEDLRERMQFAALPTSAGQAADTMLAAVRAFMAPGGGA